ncbi:MAG: hypothetical protein P1V35_07860, partial [Planctomycetota bacterium]|nr:hypothetical protein [Planctomycetota bacterium]
MIYRFCWMALFLLGLVSGANALPQATVRTLDVLVLDGVTGLPVADAPLFWLSVAEHVEKRASLEPGWKWRPEDAAVEKGRSVKLDGQGRARLQVPEGGWLLSVRWKGLYGFAEVESELEAFTLRLYPERNIAVRVLDPDGVPVPDIYAKIVAGDPEAKRKKTHARMLLDAQGRAVFGDMRHRTLGQEAASPEAFATQDLRLVLEVRGPGTVAFPIPSQAWQSGEFTAHAPALGYVMALQALDEKGDAKDQRIYLWEVQPAAPDSRPSSLASLARVNGFHRAAVRLGHEFHVSAIGGDCVSAIRQRFLGPTKPRQTVTIGPFGPTDHIRVALRIKLPPDRSSHPRSRLWIGMQRMTDRGPMGRVLLNTKGLGSEPSIDLWIPEECAQYQSQALKVTYSPAGLPERTAILPGGFGANRVLLADLTEPAGSPQASRLRPEPQPWMQRRIELHFTQPDGSDLANRNMVAQWVSLCSEPGKRPQTFSANLGRTDRWGHSVVRKPQRGEGPWQLRVHTHGNQFPVLFAQVNADPHAEHLQTIITSPL